MGDDVNILSVNAGQDTGGQSIRMKQAFDRHVPGWTYRSAVNPSAFIYLDYPSDLAWQQTAEAWGEADVVHLHNDFRTAKLFERKRGEKPAVIHYHGTLYRADPWWRLEEQRRRGAVGLVSTLDLQLISPGDTEWLPSPHHLEWLATLRTPVSDGKVRIAHAPTNRDIKSTGPLMRAVHQLREDGLPVELILIEKQPWAECLRQKAKADIYFDQVKLGYGNNAIEAWGMGIPVIAGGADATLDEMERRFGKLPFYHATEETIYDALREMVESPELRQRYADRGLAHVRKYHDERLVVEQLMDIYTRAHEGKVQAA